jgi:hypothetical protein
MSRISMLDLDSLATSINGRLRGDLHVRVQRRNGATALDLYDRDGCVKLLAIGPARAIDAYLRAMDETLYIIGR